MYSIASAIVIFPISDKVHFAIGSMCTLISGVYLFYVLVKIILEKIKNEKAKFEVKTFMKAISVLTFSVYILYSSYLLCTFFVNKQKCQNLEHFKYIPMSEEMNERIATMNEYILEKEKIGKQVYIIDTMAAVFNIPINRYYKNYDMFNLGNLGTKGEERNNRRTRA